MEVKLFANLADAAGTRDVELDLAGEATVEDALEAVCDQHPALRELLFTSAGGLEDHINVLVNGTDVRHAEDGLTRRVDADDEVAVFPPVSGGTEPLLPTV